MLIAKPALSKRGVKSLAAGDDCGPHFKTAAIMKAKHANSATQHAKKFTAGISWPTPWGSV